jgi:hypothetical protein
VSPKPLWPANSVSVCVRVVGRPNWSLLAELAESIAPCAERFHTNGQREIAARLSEIRGQPPAHRGLRPGGTSEISAVGGGGNCMPSRLLAKAFGVALRKGWTAIDTSVFTG